MNVQAQPIHHDAAHSRRFRCPCGALHTWPLAEKSGKPAQIRELECVCGQRHTR